MAQSWKPGGASFVERFQKPPMVYGKGKPLPPTSLLTVLRSHEPTSAPSPIPCQRMWSPKVELQSQKQCQPQVRKELQSVVGFRTLEEGTSEGWKQ